MLIKIIKLFIILILSSTVIVWLSNNPGKVEIIWENYFLETSLLGLGLFFFFVTSLILFLIYIFNSLKNIPKNYRSRRNEKFLYLANQSLDNIAQALLVGDSVNIEKNSRMLKKYLKNDFFSAFMLFNSSLIKNDYKESLKYLKILESIPQAKYVSERGRIVVLLKNNDHSEAKKKLIELCDKYPKDIWFHERLSKIYALEKNWKLAHDSINDLDKIPYQLKNNLANLKILNGKAALDAYKLSRESIPVVKETIKFFIDNSSLKKAAEVINQTWLNLLCLEIIEIFMRYKVKDEKEILKRYKLIFKVLKKHINERSNETKLSLAFASLEACIWGEAQKYLDLIKVNERDERVIDLYKKIFQKTKEVEPPKLDSGILPKPKWKCLSCGSEKKEWQLICHNCGSFNQVVWSKSKVERGIDSDFFKDFLQNPLRHLPKMKREN